MGDREEVMTIARDVIEALGDDARDYVAKRIEEAEAYRDGKLVTKWLMVREAVQELLQDHRLSGGDPPGSGQ